MYSGRNLLIFRKKLLPLLLGYKTIITKVIISSEVENIWSIWLRKLCVPQTRQFIPSSTAVHSRKKRLSVAIVSKTSNLAIHWFFLIMVCTTIWRARFYFWKPLHIELPSLGIIKSSTYLIRPSVIITFRPWSRQLIHYFVRLPLCVVQVFVPLAIVYRRFGEGNQSHLPRLLYLWRWDG